MRWDEIRRVELPPGVPGQLYLMAMPGRQRPPVSYTHLTLPTNREV